MISSGFEKELRKIATVKRLYGDDRYETNLAVLEESGVKKEDLLICSGNDFCRQSFGIFIRETDTFG